jgi:hypothetical protein
MFELKNVVLNVHLNRGINNLYLGINFNQKLTLIIRPYGALFNTLSAKAKKPAQQFTIAIPNIDSLQK